MSDDEKSDWDGGRGSRGGGRFDVGGRRARGDAEPRRVRENESDELMDVSLGKRTSDVTREEEEERTRGLDHREQERQCQFWREGGGNEERREGGKELTSKGNLSLPLGSLGAGDPRTGAEAVPLSEEGTRERRSEMMNMSKGGRRGSWRKERRR